MKRAASVLALVGLVALTWWLYQPALAGRFLAFDDDHNITINSHLGGPDGATARWAFSDVTYARRYLPLGWLGFSALLRVDGFNPAVFHAASLALHVVNGLLLATILAQLRAPAHPSGWAALAVIVAWWAWHPLRVEAVAWASALLYVASTTALLAAVACYFAGLERRPWLLRLSAIAYLVSLLIYPLWLGAPVALGIAGWLRRRAAGMVGRPSWRPVILATLPAAVIAGGVLAINLAARSSAAAEWGAIPSAQSGGWLALGARGLATLGWLVIKLVWPDRLTPADDLWSGATLPVGALVAGTAVVLLLAGSAWWLRRRFGPGPLLGLVAFAAVSVPLVGLTEGTYALSDRYTYSGHLVVAAGIWAGGIWVAPVVARGLMLGLLGLTLAGAVRARGQLAVWGDSDRLMAHLAAVARHEATRDFYRDWWRCVQASSGRAGEVAGDLQSGREPAPSRRLLWLLAEARRLEQQGLAWDAGFTIESSVHHQLAREARARDDRRVALAHLRRAVELAPRDWPAWSDYAVALADAGQAARARAAANCIPSTGPAAVCRDRALAKLAAMASP